MPFDAVFDASKIQPQQGGGKHPVGNKFPFAITKTEVVDTKDKTGKMFAATLTSSAGSIVNNYNLWNNSAQAVEIAAKQLSALCHAVGIFQVDFKNDGASLRGGKGLMDIGFQSGQEPSAEKPEGGYVEVKKVYDINGNEPGQAPANQQQANSGFGTASNQPQNQGQQPQQGQQGGQPQVQQGWNNSQPNNAQQQPQGQQNTTQQGSGWQQGGATEKPPWG